MIADRFTSDDSVVIYFRFYRWRYVFTHHENIAHAQVTYQGTYRGQRLMSTIGLLWWLQVGH